MDENGNGTRREDPALAARIAAGDREALRRVYEDHAERLLNLARRVLLDDDDARDLVQELFVSLPGRIAGFRGEAGLSTWLHRVATNDALMLLRSRRRRGELLKRFLFPFAGPAEEDDPTRERTLGELSDAVLGRFDPATRAMLWMADAEGIDLRTIALSLGVPEGTVKSRLSRAREKARRWLQEAGHGRLEELV